MQNSNITFDSEYKGHPINTDKVEQLACNKKILNAALNVLENHTEKHSKSLFIRMDVRYPKDAPVDKDGKVAKKFFSHLNKSLKRKKLDPAYLWRKENNNPESNNSKNDHIHAFYMVDGQKSQNYKVVTEKANELWNKHHGKASAYRGLIHECTKDKDGNPQKNGIKLEKYKQDEFNEKFGGVFKWASYLAKARPDDKTIGKRSYGTSRIKNKK